MLHVFFKKLVKAAVPEDGNRPGTLVLTKLVEQSRFEIGDDIFCHVQAFLTLRRANQLAQLD